MRVRAKYQTYLDPASNTTFSRWHPQIKVEGTWAYLPGPTTKTNLMEADSEEQALYFALNALKQFDALVEQQRLER